MEKVDVILVVWIVNSFQNAMSCGVEADNSAKLRIMDNGVLQPIELIICGRQGEYLVSKIRCTQRESNKLWQKLFPLKLGDRVRIVSTSRYPPSSLGEQLFKGKYGRISYITPDRTGMFVMLDHSPRRIFREVQVSEDDIVRVRSRNASKDIL